MMGQIVFSPLIDPIALAVLAGVAGLVILLAAIRGSRGWWLRALGALALLAGLANPSLQTENRSPLSDIVIIAIDESASQQLSDRPDQTAAALANLRAELEQRGNTEIRIVRVPDGPENSGTRAMQSLSDALLEEPADRVAGVFLITDGQVHDVDLAPDFPSPFHVMLTGRESDWDRRLVVQNAPAFAILGEPFSLQLRIEDTGAVPDPADLVQLDIAIDGAPPLSFEVPVNADIELPLTLTHGGVNVIQFATPTRDTELTDRNNAAVVQINGVRDRLRVLLVSGEPHNGERTWRNLLKSDSSVDLVHFTILRPPEKQDGVPVDELSLIAFPTRELFLEKIDEFDLIVFDRYRRRGILPNSYLENIANYVTEGGALLVSSGPEYGTVDSIYRSPLGDILPGEPSAGVIEGGFVPLISELGQRHPVTEALDAGRTDSETGRPNWGRWFRLMEVYPSPDASVVMTDEADQPLLLLDRVGEGRVALLTSDQSWLWDRGFEGGGPQLELLRRLAHWMMKEPELEEEALWAEPIASGLRIVRRTLTEQSSRVIVTRPDGESEAIDLDQITAGRFETVIETDLLGLYRITEGELDTVIAIGPSAPKEFEKALASAEILEPVVEPTNGGVHRVETGNVDIREVRQGRVASGNGWLGITPREAYRTTDLRLTSLVPSWLFLLLSAGLIILAWLREGRGSRP